MSVVDVPDAGVEDDDESCGTVTMAAGAFVPEVVVIELGSAILRAVQVVAVTDLQSLLECTEYICVSGKCPRRVLQRKGVSARLSAKQ